MAENKTISAQQDPQKTVAQFFAEPEPRSTFEGLGQGARSVARGVFAGVTGLVMHPIEGATKGGAQGLVQGLAKGVVGAVVMPVAGVGFGLMQVGKGVYNTPERVRKYMEGDSSVDEAAAKVELTKDETQGALVLDESLYSDARKKVMEAALLQVNRKVTKTKSSEPQKTSMPDAPKSSRSVKESELYDILGVESSAEPGVLKKAYYRLAMAYHPDKNGDDPVAKEKFQLVGEAYQVLSDPERREKYDRHGKASLDEAFMDPGEFLTMAFGAEHFKDFIGELAVAYTADRDVSQEDLQAFQKKREQTLAEVLIQRLDSWVQGDKEKFLEASLAEAERLRQEPFGQAMLHSIGYVYKEKATTLLGLHHTITGIPGHLAALRQQGHTFATKYKAASAALKMQDWKRKFEKKSAEEQAKLTDEALPQFLDNIWLVSVLDIESTLRHVVTRVVVDEIVDKESRRARAKGLIKLGKIFQEA